MSYQPQKRYIKPREFEEEVPPPKFNRNNLFVVLVLLVADLVLVYDRCNPPEPDDAYELRRADDDYLLND